MKKTTSFLHFYIRTFKDIAANSSILTTLILSVFFYSFFYPTAYKAEHAESLPIVIVDEEQSLMTSTIIQEVSKSPNVRIQSITGNFAAAEQLIREQKADGILLLPHNLSNSIYRGETGGIGLYLSAAYFLKTKQIGLGRQVQLKMQLQNRLQNLEIFPTFHPLCPSIRFHYSMCFQAMAAIFFLQLLL